MRAFTCPRCERLIFFANSACLSCGAELAYDRPLGELVEAESLAHPRCANRELAGCNWLAAEGEDLCDSCLLTRTRPADGDEAGLAAFVDVEKAKRHLLFEIDELYLDVDSFREREGGLGFDLLSSQYQPVTTGHADGLITVDLAESDDVHRQRMQQQLEEPYRTVLGHLRHEVGHYFFPRLCPPDSDALGRARELFGDERADYGEALDRHYADGPTENWPDDFVSAYATMHPSEDWAETFAHYLHIRDTLQTAAAHGLRVEGADGWQPLDAEPRHHYGPDFGDVIDDWLPLTYALNAINRSMGQADLYPFVLSPPAIGKLAFVHEVVGAAGDS